MDNIYLKPDKNVLVVWEFNDSNTLSTNYKIVYDAINKHYWYASADVLPTINDQLFLLDNISNTYSDINLPYLQQLEYVNVAASTYDKVKIYFPINYNFNDYPGFNITFRTLTNDNLLANVSNYYFDSTDSTKSSQLQVLSTPLKYENRLWGKYIELNIPSVYSQSRQRSGNPLRPTPGTINFNLTGAYNGDGLSTNAPIIIDFNWIELIKTENSIKKYVLYPKYTISTPQAPGNLTVGVSIEHSANGDYFEFYGTYGGSIIDFSTFMDSLESNGQKSYVIYTITEFEQGIQTESVDYYVYKDFDIKRKYRPIFTFSNTTGSLQVELKIVSYVDGSSVVKINEILIDPATLAKYGNKLMSINVSGLMQTNILNAKPDQIVINPVILNAMSRRNQIQTNTVVRSIPTPIISNNIVIKDVNGNQSSYSKQDNLELIIHPFDNYIKLVVAVSSSNAFEPMQFNNTSLFLNFTGSGLSVTIETDSTHPENKPGSGVLVFNIKSTDTNKIAKIFNETNRFYLTQKNDINETVIYAGLFIMSDSPIYLNRISKVEQPIVTPVIVTPVIPTPTNNTGTGTSPNLNIKNNVNKLTL